MKFYRNLFILILNTSCVLGCTTFTSNAVTEKAEPKTDIELRRKLDEWTEQLHSNDPTIRSSAAVSLLGLNLLNAQEPLISILKDRKEREDVQVSVIKAFEFTRDDRATDILIHLLDSESVPLQKAASDALGMLKTKPSIRKMSDAMVSPQQSLTAKILLAKALGNTNDRDAVEPLIKLLAINDRNLRDAAMKSLENITKLPNSNDSAWWKEWWNRNKAKTREQWLEDIVLKQEVNTKQLQTKIEQLELEIAQKSIKLLQTMPDKTDPKPLLEALQSNYAEVKIFAARELTKTKEPYVIDALIDAVLDNNEDVRVEVTQALGEIGDGKAVEPLIRSLDDQSIVVREKAAKSLGKLGNLDAEEPLLSALKSNTNLSIIYSIIEALGQIGSAKSVETLLTFLTHKESKVRECTASTLGKIKDIRSVNPLITALSDEQERVRWYAADSLGKIGEPICVESLAKLLTDASARVRESAVTALGQIGNQQSVESLIKVLQDIDKRVAEQAAESLVNIKQRDFETINTIANTFYEKKDYKRAEIILERQILELSKQPELLEKALQSKNKLAKTLLALKDWQKAYDIYKELAKRFSSDDSLKMELIQCLREMKKYDLLLEWYATWIKESPQNNQLCWQGRLETANAMFEQGKYESIINLIEYLKGEDPAMGGEEFKANFQRLHESCLAERKQLKTTRQISEAK